MALVVICVVTPAEGWPKIRAGMKSYKDNWLTEVVLPRFHSKPEIAVGSCIGVDQRAFCQDHLPVR